MSDYKTLVLDNNMRIKVTKEESLMEALQKADQIDAACGGNGLCGRCRVCFMNGAPLPTHTDRSLLSLEQLRGGERLACKVDLWKIQNDEIHIKVMNPQAPKIQVLSDYSLNMDRISSNTEGKTEWYSFAAIDLGTTTIAMQLIEGMSGKILQEYRVLNPERKYGADVIARIQSSMDGRRNEISLLIKEEIVHGLHTLEDKTNVSINHVILAGNTTMIQLLIGNDVTGMASYPFIPVTLKSATIHLDHYEIFLFPGASAFVGGDIVSGIYALDIQKSKSYQMLIDLGTNGEIVLGNKERIISTATAAGPAFENARTFYLPGSDMIRIVADMLDGNIIDHTGLLRDEFFETGYFIEGINISNKEIRELQKAKAAIYEGVLILMEQLNIDASRIENVYLAGGFGQGLDTKSAEKIGLIPRALTDKLKPVANTSLEGTVIFGIQKQCGLSDPDELDQLAESIQTVNLATVSDFGSRYLEAINFTN